MIEHQTTQPNPYRKAKKEKNATSHETVELQYWLVLCYSLSIQSYLSISLRQVWSPPVVGRLGPGGLAGWRPAREVIRWVCRAGWWSSYPASLQSRGPVDLWGWGPVECRSNGPASWWPGSVVTWWTCGAGTSGPVEQGPAEQRYGGDLAGMCSGVPVQQRSSGPAELGPGGPQGCVPGLEEIKGPMEQGPSGSVWWGPSEVEI
jgi:hypothetical protein